MSDGSVRPEETQPRRDIKLTPIEKIRKIARKPVSRAALTGAAIGMAVGGIIPLPQPTQPERAPSGQVRETPSPTSSPELQIKYDAKKDYAEHLVNITNSPGNQKADVWPNHLSSETYPWQVAKDVAEKNREILRTSLQKTGREFGFYDEVRPTYRFYNGNINSGQKEVFVDTSGRFKNGEGLSDIIESLPAIKPFSYSQPEFANKDYTQYATPHVLGISASDIPEDGYVMVFSRPTLREKPEAKYDIWELDTAVFSDTLKIKTPDSSKPKDVVYLVVGTQDRTDRLTPFYNKANDADVRKIAVIFDSRGKAVSKIVLYNTRFLPKDESINTYQGDKNLINPDYTAPKLETVSMRNILVIPEKLQQDLFKGYVGKDIVLSVDSSTIRTLHGWDSVFQIDGQYYDELPITSTALGGNLNIYTGESPQDDFTKWGLETKASSLPVGYVYVDIPEGTKLIVKVSAVEVEKGKGKKLTFIFKAIELPK